MTLLAPRFVRATGAIGALIGAGQVVLAVVDVMSTGAGLLAWVRFALAVGVFSYFAWFAYVATVLPVVRVDGRTITWRALASARFRSVRADDVVECRLQDAYDLRLRLRSGEEPSIRLNEVAARDRAVLVAWVHEVTGQEAAAP